MSLLYYIQYENTQKCTNIGIFECGLCNKCKTFIAIRAISILTENLQFHQAINTETDLSITTSNRKVPE